MRTPSKMTGAVVFVEPAFGKPGYLVVGVETEQRGDRRSEVILLTIDEARTLADLIRELTND